MGQDQLHRQQGALDTVNHIRESGTDLGLVALAQPKEAGAWWRALGRPSGPRIIALSPFIVVAGRPAETPALVLFDTMTRRTIPVGYGILSADEIMDRIFALTNTKVGSDF